MGALETTFTNFVMTLVRTARRAQSVHVFYHCRRFSSIRENLKTTLGGSFTLENLTVVMCESSIKSKAVSEASTLIMTRLRHLQQIRHHSVRTIEET